MIKNIPWRLNTVGLQMCRTVGDLLLLKLKEVINMAESE